MRRFILLILALATLLPSLAQAYDILILQSRRDPAYEETLKGLSTKHNASQRTLVLSDYAEVDVVRIVREDRPRLILAVGDSALTATSKIQNTPVIAVMSLGIHNRKTPQRNLTGVGMFIQPERYMSLFKTMKAKRVGVIYSSAKSGWYMRLAQRAAKQAGIELITREVSAPRYAIDNVASLAGKVDALWMLPDSTAVTRETAEAYFLFGLQQSVPVVSFASSYLGLGAAAVLELDRLAIGRQADAMIAKLLNSENSENSENLPFSFPKSVRTKTNPVILRKLGYSLNESSAMLQ